MQLSTFRRTAARVVVGGTAAAALLVGAGIGPAHAQTRERVLLARTSISISLAPGGTAGWDGCTDWTNEDGTHGTNCPGGDLFEINSWSFGSSFG